MQQALQQLDVEDPAGQDNNAKTSGGPGGARNKTLQAQQQNRSWAERYGVPPTA